MIHPPYSYSDRGEQISRWSLLAGILVAGIFLRLPPAAFEHPPLRVLSGVHLQSRLKGIGVDEKLYCDYVQELGQSGLSSYSQLVHHYVEKQKALTAAILPPVRFLYIFSAFVWQKCFGGDAVNAVRNVTAAFSMLTLLLAAVFAARLKRPGYDLALTALMAFAPTQLHISQHAIIDGFFSFWVLLVLFSFWESLCHPQNRIWSVVYGIGLVALVLTKENTLFVWGAIVIILIANQWLRMGTVSRELFFATFLAPLIGILILVLLAGGISTLIETYRLFFEKNYGLKYSAQNQDGPWQRYLVDLLLVSPLVLLLALGCICNLDREKKLEWFLALFFISTYAMMCGLRYGINLRFGNMWDFPLRVLALGQLTLIAQFIRRWQGFAFASFVVLICATEIRNYVVLEVRYPLYDLVTTDLARALHILKDLP